MTFAFQISRDARERYGADDIVVQASAGDPSAFATTRRLAQRMNELDDRSRDPARVVHGGQLAALGLLTEILRAVAALYREQMKPTVMGDALAALRARLGDAGVQQTLEAFVERFPIAGESSGGSGATEYLAGATNGVPNGERALSELLVLWLSNANPAVAPFRELLDDEPLAAGAPYGDVIAGLVGYFATQPPFGPDGQALVEMLRAPAVAVPDSLAGQLRYVREHWAVALPEFGDRLATSLDVLAEEELGTWRRFHPPGPGDASEDAARRAGRAWLTESGWQGPGAGESEPERFSTDRDWMPRLVLVAKSSFVWLDQLSRRHGRAITRLDEIPDEELDRLAAWGFTGLWLIGLWQRSRASQTIKQLRGNPEAVASAYSLDDYRIADDLGGEEAFENLKSRAWARGIRIASDMVPNHMGVDSGWVVEHPDWFVSVPEPPYPAYRFSGPDLSQDDRVGIQIEDHYFDNTDAAVVFKRWDRASGDVRYVYHGNDGTSMPWNDTAQLDYIHPEVRESVIRTILAVARRSPVIRFDAAMTLARRHIERLWYPEPGHGGAIPSRAEHAMPKAEFERLMPVEFWREVVDRVAAEVPDTLLLAEAFWLMEGYFVRTLGMHRVYNSAFMNMLRDEQNANYRTVIRNTLEFDPEVLKRYVNFMNNPDERTAVDQFGKGDKYFGIATVMATLPGLPMFGHGQVEGFGEKYGMEYRRAYWDEQPDSWMVERHEREIAPLLHRRGLFAEVADFRFYDFVRDDGTVDEDVYAYSNRGDGETSLVVYNNRYGSTSGRIRESVPYAARTGEGSLELTHRSIADGLGLHADEDRHVAMRDVRSGLETLHSSREIHARGLHLELGAYDCRVLLGIREVAGESGDRWGDLAAELGGRGVPNLADALREVALRPVREPLRRLLEPGRLRRVADSGDGSGAADLRDDVAAFVRAARELTGAPPAPDAHDAASGSLARAIVDGLAWIAARDAVLGDADVRPEVRVRAADSASAAGPVGAPAAPPPPALVAAWLLLHRLPTLLGQEVTVGAPRDWIADWRLAPVIAEASRLDGASEGDAWRRVEAVSALLGLHAWNRDAQLPQRVASILDAWLADDSTARFLQVNVHRDVRWFNREAFEAFASWAATIEALRIDRVASSGGGSRQGGESTPDFDTEPGGVLRETAAALIDAAARSGYRLDALAAAAHAAAGHEPDPAAPGPAAVPAASPPAASAAPGTGPRKKPRTPSRRT